LDGMNGSRLASTPMLGSGFLLSSGSGHLTV
jgi:hypothetical protein